MPKKDTAKFKKNESGRSASDMCEQVAHATLDLFVDYLQQALKSNPAMKLDAQELTFQSRQFKKEEKIDTSTGRKKSLNSGSMKSRLNSTANPANAPSNGFWLSGSRICSRPMNHSIKTVPYHAVFCPG